MIDDEGVERLREYCKLTATGFLQSAATTPSAQTATVFRAKAASLATMLEMLDEADIPSPIGGRCAVCGHKPPYHSVDCELGE